MSRNSMTLRVQVTEDTTQRRKLRPGLTRYDLGPEASDRIKKARARLLAAEVQFDLAIWLENHGVPLSDGLSYSIVHGAGKLSEPLPCHPERMTHEQWVEVFEGLDVEASNQAWDTWRTEGGYA